MPERLTLRMGGAQPARGEVRLRLGMPTAGAVTVEVYAVDGRRVAVARSGEGMVLLKGSGPLTLIETGPTAGNELRLMDHKTSWIVRMGWRGADGSDEAFMARFSVLAVSEGADGALTVDDPEYGPVVCHADGRIVAEGRTVDPGEWSVEGAVELFSGGR